MHLDATTARTDGVTLVSLLVTNENASPRRFRIANRLDGPLWPPRVHGTVAAGWDEAGFEGVVAGAATRPLGYATPAVPSDPAAELIWSEPAGDSETGGVDSNGVEPAGVVRRFGDPRPPADVCLPAYFRGRPDERDESEAPR
ncbi:MAG: hypothetical protein ABEJ55_03620 [Halanaeroarchaeum sp.]